MQEVELKLELAEDAAAMLAANPLLPGAPEIHALRATYFDTHDRALAAAGFSLRIRASGEERVQTVKATGPAAGLFVRSEWEMPVEDDKPVLDHTTPIRATLGEQCDTLAPVFQVAVDRRIWNVEHEGATIEVALDEGEARAGEYTAPIRELELELKDGAPSALFSFAHQLDATVPLRVGVLSKSERGYRLGQSAKPAVRAGAVELTPEMDATEAFRFIAGHCLRQFRLNEARLAEGRSSEALHQARVAIRRLRSAFSLFKPLYGDDARAAELRQDLRGLAAVLGEARNLDVLLDRAHPDDLHDLLASARESAYDRVEMALGSPRERSLMLNLLEWFATGDWLSNPATQDARGEPVHEFACEVLDRARRRLKKRGRKLAKQDDEARHEVRKSAKTLRYASEFFAALFDAKRERRRYKRFIAALEMLQDELGALNDLATAPEELDKLGIHDDPQAAVLLGDHDKKALIAAAADAHEEFADAKRFWR